MSIELNYLKVFYEVARLGRFSEAAIKLGISQSALSRSVSLLEQQQGTILFERSKTGVKLTSIGEEIFQKCEQLFQQVNSIEKSFSGTTEVCEGPIRFAATDHVVNDYLVQTIKLFKKKYPDAMPSIFSASPDDLIQSLNEGKSEFALLFSKVQLPQIAYTPLRMEKMSLVCSSTVWKELKSSSQTKTLKAVLKDKGYISSIGASLQTRPSRVLQELFGEMPKISVETNSQEAQKRFCLAGEGIAYLANFMVHKEIQSGELVEVAMEFPHEFHLWLAIRKGKELSFPAQTFVHFIRDLK